ncbi:hypothetical protein Tco_0532602 [Tanacetum coccineum]
MRETCVNLQSPRSTDVVGMAIPVQNINHSAFRSMFEKEKLSGNNFNDWFARLKLVLRVEKKMHVIEQPLPPAPEAGAEPNIVAQWTALYDAHTEIACLMLGSMTPELHRQFELHYPYDMIQELRSMRVKSVADYVLKMKGYVEQLERLSYMLPQDISVGLILNGLTKDFVGFIRKNTLCITWEDNRVGNWKRNCPCVLAEVAEEEGEQVGLLVLRWFVVSVSRLVDNGFVQCFTDCGISVSKNGVLYFNAVPRNGIYEIDMHDLVPNVNSIYNVSNKRVKIYLDSIIYGTVVLLYKHETIPYLLDMVRSMMNLNNSAFIFGDYASSVYNTHSQYGLQLRRLDKTPMNCGMEKFQKIVLLLMVWGCEALGGKRDTPDQKRTSLLSVFVIGYTKGNDGLLFLLPTWENKIVCCKVLLILIIPEKYASFKDPFMDLSKHQEAGIKDLTRKSKGLDLLKILMKPCDISKGSWEYVTILILNLGEAAYILGIKIYRIDRNAFNWTLSKCLNG